MPTSITISSYLGIKLTNHHKKGENTKSKRDRFTYILLWCCWPFMSSSSAPEGSATTDQYMLGMVEHICNINTPQVEAEASRVQSQTPLYSKLGLDWLYENNSLFLSLSLSSACLFICMCMGMSVLNL